MCSESTMTTREYSKRLGNISDEQFQRALSHYDLGTFLQAEPIPFGLFGQNLFVTSTDGEFVLRGVPHYDWQFPTEKFFSEQLHFNTRVPVPYPYIYDPSPEIFGWPFVIMPRMPGLQLADPQVGSHLSMEERRGIARALAAMLVEIQTLTSEYSGHYDITTQIIQPMSIDYRVSIVQRIQELIAQAQSYNDNTTQSDVKWAAKILEDCKDVLDIPYQPCVVLEDYKEQNTVVMRTADGWRVSGVFDLMSAHFGDGEADLARQVGMYLRDTPPLADEFVNEYLKITKVAADFVKRQPLYMLYDSVIIWEYWQRHGDGFADNQTLTLEKWASPFVSYWEKLK